MWIGVETFDAYSHTYPFRDLKEVGDSFQVDCAGMSQDEQKRKANAMSTLCGYYGRKLERTYGAEITGATVTVQLVEL